MRVRCARMRPESLAMSTLTGSTSTAMPCPNSSRSGTSYRGSDGVVRKIRFLEPMTASILANRRRVAPFRLEGGGDATVGRNYVVRADGSIHALAATASVSMSAGDAFVIETPGGGGYGNR